MKFELIVVGLVIFVTLYYVDLSYVIFPFLNRFFLIFILFMTAYFEL